MLSVPTPDDDIISAAIIYSNNSSRHYDIGFAESRAANEADNFSPHSSEDRQSQMPSHARIKNLSSARLGTFVISGSTVTI